MTHAEFRSLVGDEPNLRATLSELQQELAAVDRLADPIRAQCAALVARLEEIDAAKAERRRQAEAQNHQLELDRRAAEQITLDSAPSPTAPAE